MESGLDYFLARYYSSSQGRFTSVDPIPITPERQLNPQNLNLYAYVANNPLAYLDPTGMELVKLGQHTDEQINKRVAEIDEALKAENITNKQKQDLGKERNTLLLEQQGNTIVTDMLNALPAGDRQGLSLKDFTLSTEGKNDFDEKTRKYIDKGEKESGGAASMMFLPGSKAKQIYIFATDANYQSIVTGGGTHQRTNTIVPRNDLILAISAKIPHERAHRDSGASERTEFTIELRVLQQYGPGPFVNKEYYKDMVKFVEKEKARHRR